MLRVEARSAQRKMMVVAHRIAVAPIRRAQRKEGEGTGKERKRRKRGDLTPGGAVVPGETFRAIDIASATSP